MTIYKGSRYEYAVIDYITPSPYEPSTPIVFYAIGNLGSLKYREHQYSPGERLDTLSTMYYQTPKNWWIIVEANPEVLDFLHITAGTILRIPNV